MQQVKETGEDAFRERLLRVSYSKRLILAKRLLCQQLDDCGKIDALTLRCIIKLVKRLK